MPNIEEALFPRRKERVEDRRKERAHRDVMDSVFDRVTLLAISRLVTHGFLTQVDHSIATGKEANVFRVSSAEGARALKIYRISNSTFRHLPAYALEELRREVGGKSFGRLIFAWCRREYNALAVCHQAGVPVPRPFTSYRNLLLMEFVGDTAGRPAPPMIRSVIADPAVTADEVAAGSHAMVAGAKLVHGDLSPYNILYHEGHPVFIDVGQTLPSSHPQAGDLLRRDSLNLVRYFRHLGVDLEPDDYFARMGGDALS